MSVIQSQDLIDAINLKKWSRVFTILPSIKTHPNLLTHKDENNWNALHWCCYRRVPPFILQSIIHLSTYETKNATDDQGCTPLLKSLECFPDDERVIVMIDACDDACQIVDENGWFPLHKAVVWGRSTDVVKRLLVAYPGAVCVADNFGDTPLSVFFRDWNLGLRAVLGDDLKSVESGDKVVDRMGRSKPILWVYEVALLLLKAVFNFDESLPAIEEPNHLPFAALMIRDCPWSVFSLMLKMHPEAACNYDGEVHMFLLHWVMLIESSSDGELYKCGSCSYQFGEWSWFQHKVRSYEVFCEKCLWQAMEKIGGTVDDYVQVYSVNKSFGAVHDLVTLNPIVANFPDHTGRLPFYSSIENIVNISTGVDLLYKAAPEALWTRDITTHMYPFMELLAADIDPNATDATNYLDHFGLCFTLLLESADLVTTLFKQSETMAKKDNNNIVPVQTIEANNDKINPLTNTVDVNSNALPLRLSKVKSKSLRYLGKNDTKRLPTQLDIMPTLTQSLSVPRVLAKSESFRCDEPLQETKSQRRIMLAVLENMRGSSFQKENQEKEEGSSNDNKVGTTNSDTTKVSTPPQKLKPVKPLLPPPQISQQIKSVKFSQPPQKNNKSQVSKPSWLETRQSLLTESAIPIRKTAQPYRSELSPFQFTSEPSDIARFTSPSTFTNVYTDYTLTTRDDNPFRMSKSILEKHRMMYETMDYTDSDSGTDEEDNKECTTIVEDVMKDQNDPEGSNYDCVLQ